MCQGQAESSLASLESWALASRGRVAPLRIGGPQEPETLLALEEPGFPRTAAVRLTATIQDVFACWMAHLAHRLPSSQGRGLGHRSQEGCNSES